MKFPGIALASVLATAVVAQIPGLPSCAFSCVTNYGGCSSFDYKCICSNTQFIDTLSCCVSKSCDKQEQEITLQFAQKLCKGAGVTNLPTSASCASTATGSTTSTATGGSGTGASTTTTPSSITSKTTISGVSTVITSTATTAASSQTSAASTAGVSSSSPTATSTQGSGAGGKNIEKFGLGMAVAGLIAAL